MHKGSNNQPSDREWLVQPFILPNKITKVGTIAEERHSWLLLLLWPPTNFHCAKVGIYCPTVTLCFFVLIFSVHFSLTHCSLSNCTIILCSEPVVVMTAHQLLLSKSWSSSLNGHTKVILSYFVWLFYFTFLPTRCSHYFWMAILYCKPSPAGNHHAASHISRLCTQDALGIYVPV